MMSTNIWRETENAFYHINAPAAFSIVGDAPVVALSMEQVNETLAELLETLPEFYPAWFKRAEIALRGGNPKDGETFLDEGFRRLSELVTDEEEFYNIWTGVQESLEKLLRYDLLVKCLEKAVVLFPEDPGFFDELAFCMLQLPNVDGEKALKYQQTAMDLDEGNDYYISNMGWIQLMLGNFDKAEEFFQEAVDYNPDNETALENLEVTIKMREERLNYQTYLLRTDEEKVKELVEDGENDEAIEMVQILKSDRQEAFKRHHLAQGKIAPHDLVGMIQNVQLWLESIDDVGDDGVVLWEDMDYVRKNYKTVLMDMLERLDMFDEQIFTFFGNSVVSFYSFLADEKLVPAAQFEALKGELILFVQQLGPHLEHYFHILNDVTLEEKERIDRLNAFFAVLEDASLDTAEREKKLDVFIA